VQGLRRKGLIEDALTRLALAWCFSRQLYSTRRGKMLDFHFINLPRSRIQELVNQSGKLEMGRVGWVERYPPSCRVECVRVSLQGNYV